MSIEALKDAAARADESEFDVYLTIAARGVEIEMYADKRKLRKIVPWIDLELANINPLVEMISYMEQETKE